MNTWVGTSGFSHREWKGTFYPEDLPQKEMLSYYASQLNSVEIGHTFYRMPTVELLTGWAARVPARFSFALKASRRITHDKRLRDAGGELEYFLTAASELGPRLGPVLFQLPPYQKKDAPLLRDFLALLPDGTRAAFEFRSSSWFDDEIYRALEDRGAALVVADAEVANLPPVITRTAPFGYARLRRDDYGTGDLVEWAERLTDPGWEDLHVFFKHEEAGAGPRWAREFAGLLGDGERSAQ